MTYKLPANFTGYNANEIGIETFRTLCYALQNMQLLRVQSIHGYDYPNNYYVAYVTDHAGDFCIYMNCFCGVIGCIQGEVEEQTYLDKPNIKNAIATFAPELYVLSKKELSEPLTKEHTTNLQKTELKALDYWQPNDIGSALFTWFFD